jgi:hypothetical protein
MNLVTHMLRRAFTDTEMHVGLFNGGTEAVADGYRRIPIRWRVSNRTATSTITFGPYLQPCAYDRYVLFDGDTVIDEFLEESPAQMPRGFTWDWAPEVLIGG